jgi:hypothetical protein
MRGKAITIFLLIPILIFSQKGSTCFDHLVDTLIINAGKCKCREVNMSISGTDAQTGKSQSKDVTWTFLNDTVVRQGVDNKKSYGLIRGNYIYKYDLKKKEVISFGNRSERDSAGLKIIDWLVRAKDSSLSFSRSICDSTGRLVESFSAQSNGKLYYDYFWYYGDSIRIRKTYVLPLDSISYAFVRHIHDTVNFDPRYVTLRQKDYYEQQLNTLPILCQIYAHESLSKDRTSAIDTVVVTQFDPTGIVPPISSFYTIVSFYNYDFQGHLISSQKTEYVGNKSWNYFLTVDYKWGD